jgi:pimeloyl-ACP methyl ester carboxylesterase
MNHDETHENDRAFCRRTFFAGVAAVGTSLLMGTMAEAQSADNSVKEYDVATNGISLHVTELGIGPAVLFCHGFPDTSYTWRRQMKAVAAAGYRAIAPDMRGYGRSSAPADPALYTPLQTVGDLVGLLDALNISTAVIVGHDWGATHSWAAALMRPDRFTAVFCLTVPYVPRGDVSVFDAMRRAGHQDTFYMFDQMRPESDHVWANAAVTIPGILYWASGSAPADKRWSPMDPARSLHRPAPRSQYQRIQTHRLSRRAQLLSCGRTILRIVRSLERCEDHAACVLYLRQVRWPKRALSPHRAATSERRAQSRREPRPR